MKLNSTHSHIFFVGLFHRPLLFSAAVHTSTFWIPLSADAFVLTIQSEILGDQGAAVVVVMLVQKVVDLSVLL